MTKNIFKNLIIFFLCCFICVSFNVKAQDISTLNSNAPTIASVSENMLRGGIIFVKGQSLPNEKIILNVDDSKNVFIYSGTTLSDFNGNWSAELGQPLKKGQYYITAVSQDANGNLSSPVKSALINVEGPFALIIEIFSALVIILLAAFVSILYIAKSGEIKRYRRILASQRDIIASYNVLKNDVDKATKDLEYEKSPDEKISDVKILLSRLSENLEKMNKYVIQGVKVIGSYDIITKLNDVFKKKKNI